MPFCNHSTLNIDLKNIIIDLKFKNMVFQEVFCGDLQTMKNHG